MKRYVAIPIVAFVGFVSQHFAESSGSGKSAALRASEPASMVATQPPHENVYDTDLSITHLDISFKTDFQSNNVDTVVKASVENFSGNTVDRAEFLVCPGENDPDFGETGAIKALTYAGQAALQ